jgi:hypothetical protein
MYTIHLYVVEFFFHLILFCERRKWKEISAHSEIAQFANGSRITLWPLGACRGLFIMQIRALFVSMGVKTEIPRSALWELCNEFNKPHNQTCPKGVSMVLFYLQQGKQIINVLIKSFAFQRAQSAFEAPVAYTQRNLFISTFAKLWCNMRITGMLQVS